ncbi:hypothetical protein D0Y83_05340 [Qipengyuania flava]|uniref:Uncharacterized protein n=1 Tax=Qipengyuania flava TaxID=192812 RepID=A0A5P6N9P7_9SPHN|nr:hypothetical protein D0Y83_05340 [Qipengyuania flava]
MIGQIRSLTLGSMRLKCSNRSTDYSLFLGGNVAQQLVLHFETTPNQILETEVAAQALLDWVDLVKSAVAAVDPTQELTFGTVGVTPGSTRFPQLVSFLDRQVGRVKSSWDDHPHLKSVIVGSAHTLFTASVAAGVSLAMQPNEQTVRLSDEDRDLLKRAEEAPEVQQANRRFYRTLERDRSIEGIGVAKNWNERPTVIIPRREFAERSGVWVMDSSDPKERTRSDLWDVILLRPHLLSTPQSWQFSKDGFKFSAKMHDAKFLQAIHDGTVPLTLQEGVMMRVQVEYNEVLVGQVWETVPNSRRIVKVLSPSPNL